jgi:N-methylhydantoinase A
VRVRLEEASLAAIRAAQDQLAAAADAWFARQLIELRERKITISFDMRYVGQNFELRVPGGSAVGGKLPGLPDLKILRARFFRTHNQYYGFHNAEDPVEIINIRLTASAKLVKLKLPHRPKGRVSRPKPVGYRPVWFSEARAVKTSIYDREALKPGHALTGPAVIEQFDSTSILYPGDALLVDEPGNLLVSVHP